MQSKKGQKQITKMPKTIQEAQEKKRRQEVYQQLVAEKRPKVPYTQHFLTAFISGGLVCVLGQFVLSMFMGQGLDINAASAPTLAVMILIGIVFTAFGIYDEFAEFTGAGAAVPITGFANTIAASAIDFKREGWVLGMGTKMFIVAGPVIVYGILTGIVTASISYIAGL